MCVHNGTAWSFYMVKLAKGRFSDCFSTVEFPVQDTEIRSWSLIDSLITIPCTLYTDVMGVYFLHYKIYMSQ